MVGDDLHFLLGQAEFKDAHVLNQVFDCAEYCHELSSTLQLVSQSDLVGCLWMILSDLLNLLLALLRLAEWAGCILTSNLTWNLYALLLGHTYKFLFVKQRLLFNLNYWWFYLGVIKNILKSWHFNVFASNVSNQALSGELFYGLISLSENLVWVFNQVLFFMVHLCTLIRWALLARCLDEQQVKLVHA